MSLVTCKCKSLFSKDTGGGSRWAASAARIMAKAARSLPVPPGFTITTEVCDAYYKAGEKLPGSLMDEVKKAVATLEKELKKKFGDNSNPLLVSVRKTVSVAFPTSPSASI